MAHFATFTKVHSALFEYRAPLVTQAATLGYPVTRAMVLAFPQDAVVRDEANSGLRQQFFFGDLLLVAPVMDEGAVSVRAYLPADEAAPDGWVHLWTNVT